MEVIIVMLELLGAVWSLFSGLLLSLWGGAVLVWVFALEVLTHLHTEMPRVEGLLVGILLTWLLARRDKHPLLRVLSAPLRLVLDILDLVWDQCVEVVTDLKDTVFDWLQSIIDTMKGWASTMWSKLVGGLNSLKDKLSKSEE